MWLCLHLVCIEGLKWQKQMMVKTRQCILLVRNFLCIYANDFPQEFDSVRLYNKRFCIIICNLVNFWPNRICLICTGIFNFFDSPRMLCDVYFWKGGGTCVRNIQMMTIKKKRLLVVMWWLESCLICLP